ncbi:hypothetical protein GCM10007420_18300 [Glycocaulis albus]|jgi:hypothetical protein|uniref:DUF1489 family protein n=1 Tax=Glycocaulis albus TaxID=1382801 RepID=A0ABQ1XT31_9PROT|nr:DUF1489 domain-containing protein [Glycocaulis albus]MBV5257972.1 DUF1489 family protein [Synechococcus moorigangaii CMS01]GGH02388.1 hypothetical protein GCM10007420_18300 [Glycocaulis albus]
MSLHLIKLCVGADTIEDLEAWRAKIAPGGKPMYHVTRMSPKRADELLDGGSLYWVIKRVIQVRQRIIGLEEVTGSDGISRCCIWLDREIIRTAPRPKKPFQGWRYLTSADAPPDLSSPASGGEDLPDDLRAKLIEMGAW